MIRKYKAIYEIRSGVGEYRYVERNKPIIQEHSFKAETDYSAVNTAGEKALDFLEQYLPMTDLTGKCVVVLSRLTDSKGRTLFSFTLIILLNIE